MARQTPVGHRPQSIMGGKEGEEKEMESTLKEESLKPRNCWNANKFHFLSYIVVSTLLDGSQSLKQKNVNCLFHISLSECTKEPQDNYLNSDYLLRKKYLELPQFHTAKEWELSNINNITTPGESFGYSHQKSKTNQIMAIFTSMHPGNDNKHTLTHKSVILTNIY